MKFEDEIKQSRFESEAQKAILNIKFTASWLSSMMHSRLKPFGISQEQYNVLRILRGQYPKPCTLSLISSRMIDRMSNATRLVDKLCASGFATREICGTNRRKVDILITQKGLDLLRELDPIISGWIEELQSLPNESFQKLNEFLDQLRG